MLYPAELQRHLFKNPYFSRLFGLPGKDRCSFWTLFGLADPPIFSSNFEGDFANEHDILSSALAKPVKSERRVELQSRNEFFKISLLNISLGGGRSIQLSYWGVWMCPGRTLFTFYWKNSALSRKSGTFFSPSGIYCNVVPERRREMWQNSDPQIDLDDLIFDQQDGGPSQR